MSGKIRSKDLAYDAALPPFLQRLRNQNVGRGDTDRHERPVARPRLAKDANDDDGPTVVDETGETITQQDFEKRSAAAEPTSEAVEGKTYNKPETTAAAAAAEEALVRVEQRVTDGTTTKKRKAARIIADEAAVPEDNPSEPAQTIKKAKKKSKPIKLAFEAHEHSIAPLIRCPASPAETEFGTTPIDPTFGTRVVTPPRNKSKATLQVTLDEVPESVQAESETMDKYSKQAGDDEYDSDADADDEFERSMIGSPAPTTEYPDDHSDHSSVSEEEHESVDGEDTPTTQGYADRDGRSPSGSISDWTAEDVASFIVTLSPQMKQYTQAFVEEAVNGEAICAVQHDELRELGINSVGHRLTILRAVYDQKLKNGIKIVDGEYIPLSVDSDKGDMAATQDDIARIIESIRLRDQRIIAAEAELRAMKQDLDRIMDDNRKLREETLPALRLMKDHRAPLPDPTGGTIPSPREIDIVKASEPLSAAPTKENKGSSLSRKFSARTLFLSSAPKQSSPTHPPALTPSVRDDGGTHLEASAAAMAASTHLTASMTSQPSPIGSTTQPLSPASPAYSTQPSSGGSYHAPNSAALRTSARPHYDEPSSAHTTWNSSSTLVDPPTSATRPQDRVRRQAPTPSPRDDEAPSSARESRDAGVEIFKSFRVSVEDPCEVVLPVALKRYNIHDDWRQYSLYIVHGDQERCLGLKEKPLLLFKQLDREGRKPMFMLRRHASPQNGWSGVVGGGGGGGAGAGAGGERHIPGGVL
ncbi:hypothetical protein AMS68_000252 [Peltaster fructicola]|uniref:SAM domain-containing protein n=1 Tax=Peltaster fructicola TaxID=286661 RepID=A0A6H0XJD1_9PEZI|nr:hypothetical protein AMS68_000252 [Peltaster fructicola]